MKISVLLADDHAILRDGLKAILNSQTGIEVIGDAEDGHTTVALAQELKPDIILMDISMPKLNGIDASEKVLGLVPETRVIMLSMHSNSEYIQRAFKAGARGYLLKESAGQEVVKAVQMVYQGHFFLSQRISDMLLDVMFTSVSKPSSSSLLEKLSLREREVLQLVSEGRTSVEIAEILSLSPKSIDTYRNRLMQKLEVSNIANLVKFAIQHGIITLEE